jgi:hypothetical protein
MTNAEEVKVKMITHTQLEIQAQRDVECKILRAKKSKRDMRSVGIRVFWDVKLVLWVHGSRRFESTVLRNVCNLAPNDVASRIRSGKSSVKQK